MGSSTATLTPSITPPMLGAGAVAEKPHTTRVITRGAVDPTLVKRARRPGYSAWLAHVAPAAACSHPIRLRLDAEWHSADGRSSELHRVSDEMPDGRFYVACKNRRAPVCPACAETYRADTYQLVKAGLLGGKGVPDTVTEHPCFFVTLTAPTFGPVHSRSITRNGRVKPCRVRRHLEVCEHGKILACWHRHDADDPRVGEPLCRDCYDYQHQAVWNLHAAELWRRTTIALNRALRAAAIERGLYSWENGEKSRRRVPHVRLSYAKVAEYQRRGVVHFHALIRLDGYDPSEPESIITPDAAITPELLRAYIEDAARTTSFTTRPHPHNRQGWDIAWGQQLDIRPVHLQPSDVDDAGTLTTDAVAGYLAKYATKATEEAGHTSRRLSEIDIIRLTEHDTHQSRQLQACWSLGRRPFYITSARDREEWDGSWGKLCKWAHMLGFGGHFSTKSRRYSTTLGALRAVRRAYQRGEPIEPPPDTPARDDDQDGDDAAVTLIWTFDGAGWLTTGDAALANTSAAMARERRQTAREEIEHALAS
ncbi:MAG: hypothetical protein GEV04_15330 [Actinophytocola sp.]|nr:hypothetical protein [Actinophytocola sp.]